MIETFSLASHLSASDYGILLACVGVMIAIGYFSGRDQDTTKNFFLGNRSVPMWAACLSFVATEISAVTIISVPATVYRENWNYLQLFIGSFASRIFLAFIFIPAFYKFNVTTIYEYLKHRFGPLTQYTATCFFFVTRLLGSGVRLTVAATAVSVLIGLKLIPTIILFVVVGMFYIGWGGIKAIIWTGVWQTLTFVIGGIATLWFLSSQIDGGFFGILSAAHHAGKMAVFDWGPRVSDPGFFKTIMTDPNIWWLAILNGFVGSVAAYGTDHELMQRLLTLETREKSQKTTLATPIAGLFVLSLYMLIGCGLFVFYQQHGSAILPAKLDDIYPHFVNGQMPAFLRGLILSVVIMASIDSPLGSLTASFVNDIYRPLIRGGETDGHYLVVARVMVVVFGIILGILAFCFSFLSNFLWLAFKIGGVTFGSLLGVFLLGLFTERKSNRANLVSMLTLAFLNATLLVKTQSGWTWLILMGTFGHVKTQIGWTWLILIGTFGTMGLSYVLAPFLDKDA